MQGAPDAPSLSDGRYTLTRRLGEGGMATVFLGWDTKLKVWRAIKVLLPTVARKAKLRKRFENEAHAMARLEHPNIVRVYDVGLEDHIPYMVMELAEGGCIIDWLARYGSMPPRLAVDVTVQICRGIRAAHEAGIVHRDIKPHNVLVSRKGICKVTDFGIAQVSENDTLTKTGSVMGTWGFMAPEQRTDAKTVDGRADVFSIGATLYTLLTHRTPTELYVAEPDDEIFDGIPPELLEVILKACRYKPADRYPDTKSLAMDVHKAGQAQPQVPPSTPSLVLSVDPLPESVESAPLSPTIVIELNRALGRLPGTTAPEDTDPGRSTPKAGAAADRKVLPYYMPPTRSAEQIASLPPNHLPSYIDESEFRRTTTTEEDRPQPVPSVAPPTAPLPAVPVSSSDLALKLAVVPLMLVLLALLILGWGVFQVNGAQDTNHAAVVALHRVMERQGPVIDALAQAGASRQALDQSYFAFADAELPDRPATALAYIALVEHAVAEHEGSPQIAQLGPQLDQLYAARQGLLDARAGWSEASGGLPGSLAVTLGLSHAPPPLPDRGPE